MAEGGRDVFWEARRDNHLNIFTERMKNVSCKVHHFEAVYHQLQGVTSVLLLYPNFIEVVDDLASIISWLEISIQQEFVGDEEFLTYLRREKDEIRHLYNIIYDLSPLVGVNHA